jgi:hypothetical protein
MNVIPKLSDEQIGYVASLVARYIAEQHEKYVGRAIPLSSAQMSTLAGFFTPELLDAVRILILKEERVQNPAFYSFLRDLGFINLPDQTLMAASTFHDVVVAHEPFMDGLLFHEMVHVAQYRYLGLQRFAERYVRGFLSGGGYDAIPLEVQAYGLGGRFEHHPEQRFSVEEEVRRWDREGRL